MVDKNAENTNSLGVAGQAYFLVALVAVIVGSLATYLFSHFTLSWEQFPWTLVAFLGVASFVAFLITVFSVAYYVAGVCMCPPWYKPTTPEQGLVQDMLPEYWQGIQNDPKTDLGLAYKDIEFRNDHSSQTLRGWYVPPDPSKKKDVAAVLVHGGGRDRRAFLRHVPMFHDNGYACILFDFGEHGISDGSGRGFTYGVREHHDVTFAVKYVKEKLKYAHVVVVATSVGATSSIIAAALDENIDAVVAENPLTRAEELLANIYWKGVDYFLGPKWSRNVLTRLFGRVLVFVFLYRIGAIDGDHLWSTHRGAIDLVNLIAPRPILLMHGTHDNIIPHTHSERIFKAAREPKELWLVDGAVHCALYDKEKEEYTKRVLGFMDNVHDSKCKGKE